MKSARKTLSLATALPLLSLNCLIQLVLGIAPCWGASATGETSFREVRWLEADGPPVSPVGNTWGVPWPRGTVPAQSSFALRGADGKTAPMQSWPIAFWPDGSLKWTAHAIPASADVTGPLRIEPGPSTLPAVPLSVTEVADAITVNTGVIQCRIRRSGDTLIDSIVRDGKTLARTGRLVCLLRNSPDLDADGAIQQESFYGTISSAAVEQNGPVRAVIKIEGKHCNQNRRAWLPFVVRFYFYAGADSVRMMHTIIFDGDQSHDFISGLGIRFSVPLTDQLHDRHIRFAGEGDGVWGEAVRGITGLQVDPGSEVRKAQIAGRKTPPLESWREEVGEHLDLVPAFGDFTLSQLSSDAFEIRKRTKPGFTWVNSATGHRAAGLAYVGGPSGGVAFGIRSFWQSYPSQLNIRDATSGNAEVTAWLWSPDARPMDMRG